MMHWMYKDTDVRIHNTVQLIGKAGLTELLLDDIDKAAFQVTDGMMVRQSKHQLLHRYPLLHLVWVEQQRGDEGVWSCFELVI